MGSKTEPGWIGPGLIVESLTKGRVKLKKNKTDKKTEEHRPHQQPLALAGWRGFSSTPGPRWFSQWLCQWPSKTTWRTRRWRLHLMETQADKDFQPTSKFRKYLSTTLGLPCGSVVYCGRTKDLGPPRHTYKIKVVHYMNTDRATGLRIREHLWHLSSWRLGNWCGDLGPGESVQLRRRHPHKWWLHVSGNLSRSFDLQPSTEHELHLENKDGHLDVVISDWFWTFILWRGLARLRGWSFRTL